MATVKALIKQYERREIDFAGLRDALAAHGFIKRQRAATLGDNDFFWIDSAVDRDVITLGQRAQIIAALIRYGSTQLRSA
jgi:hypothetical protein